MYVTFAGTFTTPQQAIPIAVSQQEPLSRISLKIGFAPFVA